MIEYNWMREAWEDDNDPSFHEDMTPEGSSSGELDITYNSQEEFYKWYYQEP